MPTILDLLMALNRGDLPPLPDPAPSEPIPYAPVPNLGPLSNETTAAFGALNPEPVPPRFIPPSAPDMNFVNQYAGPEPTRPVIPDATRLQKIAAVLSGVGVGPEYGMALREERERPIKEYNAAAERYQGRRAQGLEAAERRAEREAAQANRLNEQTYEREYRAWLSKNSDRSDEAKERMRQMFTLQRDANAARLEEEKEQRRERREREADARVRTGRIFTVTKNMALSTELGRHYAGLSDKPLSAAAAKLDAQLQGVGEAQMGRAMRVGVGGGGGTGGGVSKQTAKLIEEFNNVRQNLITATARGDAQGQKQHRMRLNQLVKRLAGRPGVEAGFGAGQWPYVKVNGVLQGVEAGQPTQAAPQSQIADPLGIR